MNRSRVRLIAVVAATALGVAATAISLFQDDGGPSPGTTAPGTVTAPPGTTPTAPEAPPVAAWGDFPGAPADLTAPPGGAVSSIPSGGLTTVAVSRADGTVLGTVRLDAAGRPTDARFYDPSGALTTVVAALRTRAGGVGTGGARVRCGSPASARAGFRWTRFPIRWRLGTAPVAPRLTRTGALAAIRRARGTWNANRSHCGAIPDRSRARFAFAGSSRRTTGNDGVNLVEFGDVDRLGGVCAGTVACTITFVQGGRAVESDTRIDRVRRNGYFTDGARRRGIDLGSVMVHESGHTLGFDHVQDRSVVMFPVIGQRTVGGRRLGRGDALVNNRTY